jgi:hypothetical protein
LKILEMEKGLILHVVHVSGRQMIAQGTDGLSRADHSEGVMQGNPMEHFIPLHLSPTQREGSVKDWFDKVTKGLDLAGSHLRVGSQKRKLKGTLFGIFHQPR